MKLFIFDMGNVVAHNVAVEGAAAKAAGMSEREFFEACKYDRAARGKIINKKIDIRDADIMTMLSNGEVTTDEFWSEFEKRTGVRVSTDYLGLFFNPVLDGAVVDIVKALRKKYRVVCGTNTIQSHYDIHLARGDYALFDKTYASNMIGASKPDVEFWKRIMLGEGVAPEDIFFTDDNEANCAASSSLGIRTFHFTNADDLRNEVRPWL
ncbi:HAD-IA family hydrolase [Treponema sp. Marseille-Q4132]|uniref:HAD-IA family hydrolase n=1 Tax=Treponema sp. Marseille-Q4132 TaxID=2766701 RepID=UPI001652F78F|nr:HAD-IA family hydrolase [Treponema sp. Marseille-Q4132]QNL96951.1 HAD-IA family hydrolase [Treponema sp. Marseille-Q4132]